MGTQGIGMQGGMGMVSSWQACCGVNHASCVCFGCQMGLSCT
jgi:hypothetical protein